MARATVRRPFTAALRLAGAAALLAACDQWALFVSSDGVLAISIVSDGYQQQGRFRVRASQGDMIRTLDVPASGQLSLSEFNPGEVELLLIPPAGCAVAGPNPRTSTARADERVDVAFEVHCG